MVRNTNSVEYKIPMRIDNYLKRLRAFQRILNCNLRIYEHIWYENYDFMLQKWEKINQKFFLLKVASDKKFGQHFPELSTAFASPYQNGAIVCLRKTITNSFILSRAYINNKQNL
jgi:hypothetical protein